MFILLFGLIFVGVPIAVSLGLPAAIYFLQNDISMKMFIQQVTAGAGSYPLLAIPFFMFAGDLLGAGGVAKRLIDFASKIVGFIWGGLAQVLIVGSMFLSGISGSSASDATAIGTVLIPEMRRKGYPTGFAVAINACASTIGIIIPPSIPMVIYAWIAGESVGKMFLGGFVPGILFGLVLIVISYITAKKNNYPREAVPTFKGIVKSFKESILSLLFPVLVLGGIAFGVVTPTEAGIIAVVYGLILGLFVYKDLKFKDLPEMLLNATKGTAVVMFVLATASALSWILTYEQIPKLMVNLFNGISSGKIVFLIFVNLVCFFLGMFIGGTGAALMLITPVFLPIAHSLGISGVHLGIIMITNLAIGLVTPPVGTTLFISCRIASNMPIMEGFSHCTKFLWPMVTIQFLISFVPALVMFIPDLIMGK